jgi:radical SAM superfamily enzyme YgiQ (UPF0313 family)
MKILLATLSIEPESRGEHSPNVAYSIGLAYLHAELELAGHEVRLLFLNNVDEQESARQFFAELDSYVPDLVGFQIFSMNRVATFNAVRRLCDDYQGLHIVLGGVHVSVLYEQIVAAFPSTIAVRGEADESFPEVVRALEQGGDLAAISGIAFWRDGKVLVTPPRGPVEKLDSLPFPRHEVFFDNEPHRDTAHVITSRGCPFDCSFCCLKAISLRRCRVRNIDSVVEEIAYLKQRYPRLRRIQFHDDTLLLDNNRVIALCKALIKANLGLNFICSGRVKPVSAEMFSWMARAGFTKLMFGLETGSPLLLESIRKKIAPEDVINLFTLLRPFDFTVTTFLMCGFPGETEDTVSETIDLVKKTQRITYNSITGIGKLWVYPGTDICQIMKDRGKLTDAFWLSNEPVPFFTAEHSLAELCRFEERMMINLSICRILTWQGFRHHFLSVPGEITRFLCRKKNIDFLTFILKDFLNRHTPFVVPAATKLYRSIRQI